jgi:hypothetical protein
MSNNQIKPVIPVAPTTSADTGGLISQGDANKMQNDALNEPPVAAATAALHTHQPVSTEKACGATCGGDGGCGSAQSSSEGSQFNTLTVCLMFTLNLSNEAFAGGAAKSLRKISADGKTLNLYSPFRKAKEDKGIAAGMFRPMLNRMMEVTSYINGANIVIAGTKRDTLETMHFSVDAVRGEIQALFPNIEIDESQVALANEVCNSTSWVSEFYDETSAVNTHTAVINFVVNSGSFYDEVDRIKTVRNVKAVLGLYASKNPGVPILLSVALPADAFEFVENRDLITMMIDEDQFDLYSRKKLMLSEEDWIPSSAASIEKDLLPAGADMILTTIIGEDEPEAAAE